MKLVHLDYAIEIILEENKVQTLVVESPSAFRKLLWELESSGDECRWVLSDEGSILPMEKKLEVIINPYSLDTNQRKFITQLYNLIEDDILETGILSKWNGLTGTIIDFMDNVSDVNSYEVVYNDDVNIKDFLKLLNVRFDNDKSSMIENIMEYVLLARQIFKIEIFAFVNLKSYLEKVEINLLLEKLLYEKIHVVLFESMDREALCDNEDVIIMDCDYCVIYK